jgi:hypothetical protein
MPAISLVVCLHRERDFLERLLRETAGLFDDLVVIHDGPESAANDQVHTPDEIRETPPAIDYSMLAFDSPLPSGYHTPPVPAQRGSTHELTTSYGGRYFEGPRCFQQEPHWPLAWSRAKHDWILRLDADELPSEELKAWLHNFRNQQAAPNGPSGYTCIWPIWNGQRAVTSHWPAGRNFLFHRERIRFLGVAENVPTPDDKFEVVSLVLKHEPKRKSHGLRNILKRKQAARWRAVIAQSLAREIADLPRWRWTTSEWPVFWSRIRKHPIGASIYFFFRNTPPTVFDLWRKERKLMPLVALATPFHHMLIGFSLHRLQKKQKRPCGNQNVGC